MPKGWSIVHLADVVQHDAPIIYGILQPGPNVPDGVPYVRPTEIDEGTIDLKGLRRTSLTIAGRYKRARLETDDVLLSIVGTIGKVAIVPPELSGGNITQSSCRLRPDTRIIAARFLSAFLLAPQALRQFGEMSLGTAVPRLNLEDVRKINFPLPPPAEQRRIVAKLKALTGRTARARADLDRVGVLAERQRQALLSWAFRGSLSKGLPVHGPEWRHLRVDEFADVGTGSTPKRGLARFYDGGTIPWITSSAVNSDVVNEAEQFITETALKETNCKLFAPGALLVAMYGEGQTRGKVAKLGISAATNQALAAISVRSDAPVESDFLLWFLRANYLELRSQAAGGVQPNLSLGIIKAIEVPIPPRSEQREIIRRIETAFAEIDRLAAEATAARRLLDRLDQAILAKAFRGELVPQDPSDEPASVLLERIRHDRAAAPASTRRGRKPRAA
jgi:type I restriction enzyme S subunit